MFPSQSRKRPTPNYTDAVTAYESHLAALRRAHRGNPNYFEICLQV